MWWSTEAKWLYWGDGWRAWSVYYTITIKQEVLVQFVASDRFSLAPLCFSFSFGCCGTAFDSPKPNIGLHCWVFLSQDICKVFVFFSGTLEICGHIVFSWHQIDLVPCCKQFESHLYLIVSVWVQRVVYWAQWSCDVKYRRLHLSWNIPLIETAALWCTVCTEGLCNGYKHGEKKVGGDECSCAERSYDILFVCCSCHMIRNMQWTFYFVRSVLSVSALSSSKVILLCWFKQ